MHKTEYSGKYLEPRNKRACVKSAGVGEYNLFLHYIFPPEFIIDGYLICMFSSSVIKNTTIACEMQA